LDKEGNECGRDSFFLVESLGKGSERAFSLAKDGQRIFIDGYVRSEEKRIKIRTYAIYLDKSFEAISYKEGIKKSLNVIKDSRDIYAATKILQQLLEDT